MIKGLVTVVLPIYNVEQYLNTCIESVVNQTYRNLEILLIDDGSPDKCPEICDDWAAKDSRIRVIHKKNEGLGMARNTGIENANGEYICFFDSDDYIELDTIESTFLTANKHSADVVIFGFKKIDDNGNILFDFVPTVGERVYKNEEVLEDFFPDFIAPDPTVNKPKPFYMSTWILMFSTRIIKESGWWFVSEREIVSEDVYSLLSLFKYVNCVAVLPKSLYFYRINNNSLSRSYVPDKYAKIKFFYSQCLLLCEKMGYSKKIIHRVSKPYIAFTIAALKQEIVAPKSFREKIREIKRIIGDGTFQDVLKKNKTDIVGTNRRILFFFARHKLYFLCYALLKLKS